MNAGDSFPGQGVICLLLVGYTNQSKSLSLQILADTMFNDQRRGENGLRGSGGSLGSEELFCEVLAQG